MADMQEGDTNIPDFTEEANTCRFWFKTNPSKMAVPISTYNLSTRNLE